MDNIVSVSFSSSEEVRRGLAVRFKARRLAMNLTQEGLAARSGVSWGSLKRFESKGLIALDALLRLALVMGCLGDFEQVCADENELASKSLDDLLAAPKPRRKGRIK